MRQSPARNLLILIRFLRIIVGLIAKKGRRWRAVPLVPAKPCDVTRERYVVSRVTLPQLRQVVKHTDQSGVALYGRRPERAPIAMLTRIEDAIRRRTCLLLDYPPGQRLIEPHVLGRGKDGQYLLRAFQVEGESASATPEEWKLFRLDRIEKIVVTARNFAGPRPKYNPDDKAMQSGIIARL